ncbi:uncharacterized protein LOC113776362 isoform X1 [Coffea eugenioides]|uniref:uncharacterized protein LOC113776362 isoform X1 n=1 Tax=Coffea eugenioides TaxID=49369 RepID=UPI000F60FA1D|nr:uncharacterized protein LOC113776362 isoform X1 [Coffea eugenioides]
MGFAQALFACAPLPPPPPPLHQKSSSVPTWHFSSFTASPRHSQFNNLYQEHEELGFKKQKKKKENHNSILESHRPYKTAPTHTQYKKKEVRDGKVCDESQSLDFVSHFSTRRGGDKGGKEGERKPTGEDEEGLDVGRPEPEEEEEEDSGGPVVCKGIAKGTRRRQIMKRSTMIAKQVISIQSALSLGFVSQLWVDTNAWAVLFVEVKPNLLSSELERFSLDELAKVGDVVLVEDESVMENDFKLIGLETLVGYTVATPGRRNIGKVRGYNFDINSGVVESLEIDSFGISIIPSSLVSTYALLVEDVLEVLPDTVVVHEAAASRIQRLTKGFWGGGQKMGGSVDDDDEFEECCGYGGSGKRNLSRARGKFPGEVVERADEWELPMDYL